MSGKITRLNVEQGETAIMGTLNKDAATLLTISDMSELETKVKVDETDIVNVKLGQPAEITVDAIPNRTFSGHVIEIGNTAILRSTGLAASQSAISSQEAKDFKDSKVIMAIWAFKEFLEMVVTLVLKEIKVFRVLPSQEIQDHKDRQDRKEFKDRKEKKLLLFVVTASIFVYIAQKCQKPE